MLETGQGFSGRKHSYSGLNDLIIWKTFGGIDTGIEIQHLIRKPDYNSLETNIQKTGLNISQPPTAAMANKSIINSVSAACHRHIRETAIK